MHMGSPTPKPRIGFEFERMDIERAPLEIDQARRRPTVREALVTIDIDGDSRAPQRTGPVITEQTALKQLREYFMGRLTGNQGSSSAAKATLARERAFSSVETRPGSGGRYAT